MSLFLCLNPVFQWGFVVGKVLLKARGSEKIYNENDHIGGLSIRGVSNVPNTILFLYLFLNLVKIDTSVLLKVEYLNKLRPC